jgi:hypothetical protein
MNQLMEKVMFMAIPLLLSVVSYMWTTLQTTKEEVMRLRIESELARERIKHEILTYAASNRERIIVVEEQLKELAGK